MIDWLTLSIPFFPFHVNSKIFDFTGLAPALVNNDVISMKSLGVPLEVFLDSDGEETGHRHPWESIPSNYSGMAFKVFDLRELKEPRFFVQIQGSPAKLLQGHNVYGSDDLAKTSLFMIDLLVKAYPVLSDYLDFQNTSVDRVDITYFSRADNNREAEQFITALSNISRGQTKCRHGYAGQTAYFGKKNSRLKKLKVYLKPSEVDAYIKKQQQVAKSKKSKVADLAQYKLDQIYTPELLQWCEGMVRWEATLKTRWFHRRGISTLLKDLNKLFTPQEFWLEAFSDIFKSLEGEQMRLIEDNKIEELLLDKFQVISEKTGKVSYSKAKNAYLTYRRIKSEGFIEAQRMSSCRSTFYNHLSMLHDIGLSLAVLQNMTGGGHFGEVVPMIRFITVNFSQQFPPFAQAA